MTKTISNSLTKKMRGYKRRMKNIENHVPKGMYCYGYRKDGVWVHPCPFLKKNKSLHHQENGVCTAFNIRDTYENGGLLFDWVKECNINRDDGWETMKDE